ncbi:unnamed protein product [Trichogramma brassicae]|uniref:Integrase catalytic domain-containing protein n=1 Tax=Trichogramma brassicae TaxID=86971 RepID=A0A6H5I4Q2_9HYME|nr:unnamed protein product [Trichogramma brassicae]
MVRLKRWIKQRWNRGPCPDPLQPMTAQELGEAFEACLVRSQLQYFEVEARELRHSRPVPRKSPLAALDPFLDAKGILRVGGRLHHSALPFHLKHPPILDGSSHLATLVIDWAHARSIHGGFKATYVQVFQRAWLINGRRRIRHHVSQCVTCAAARVRTTSHIMAPLPASRVTAARPFERTGVDYAGPFLVRQGRGKGIPTSKAWVAVFVCLVTKAIHLELVGNLKTDSLLGALTRFVGRRRRPREMWSDNATNFHRADFEIRAAMKSEQIRWPRLADYLAEEGIEWKFIPPSAPHFGGLWEAAVRSFKFHLKRAVGTRHVTYEELNTLIIGVEAVLNSRPLEPVTGDPDDLCVLTPSSESTGMSLLTLPDKEPSETPLDKLQNWKLVEGLRADFWSKWSRTYLNTLQQRHKWQRRRASINVGDIVLIVDPSLLLPCGRWPLGRVTHTYPGSDGQVRVAQVQTASGSYKRPVVKLVSLPVRTNPPDPASPIPAHGGRLAHAHGTELDLRMRIELNSRACAWHYSRPAHAHRPNRNIFWLILKVFSIFMIVIVILSPGLAHAHGTELDLRMRIELNFRACAWHYSRPAHAHRPNRLRMRMELNRPAHAH